jgi:trehalose-phosphatase
MTGVPLFEAWDEVEARLAAAPAVWLGTDFDGTLTEHVDDPFAVELAPAKRDLLAALHATPGVAVAVVSGRALADLIPRVGLPDFAYAGNHGLEIEAPGLSLLDEGALAAEAALADLRVALHPYVTWFPGAFLEGKRLTLEVHYRVTPETMRDDLRRAVDSVLTPAFVSRHLEVGTEIRPAGAGHKGTASLRLRDHQLGPHALPVFVGDSATDEDAFRTLPDGVTVKVGPGPTDARYRVECPAQVQEFYRRLHALSVAKPRPL